MIVAKQMIKINQLLPVGWSLSIGKIQEKPWTPSPTIMSNVPCKVRINRLTLPEHFFYFLCQKKLKKPWGQGWMKTKLLELKHLLDQKNSANEKPPQTEGLYPAIKTC